MSREIGAKGFSPSAVQGSMNNEECVYVPPAPGDEEAARIEREGLPFPLVNRKGWVRICGIWMQKSAKTQGRW